MAKKKDGLTVAIAVGKPKTPPPDDDTEGDDFAEATPPEDDYLAEEAGKEPPPPDEEESEGAYPEFTIPAGLDLSDMEPGEEREVLCIIGKTADDTACIKQVDGVDLAGEGQGMYGPPPAAPVPPPPPPGMMGPPPAAMLAGGPPMGPPPPGGPIRGRAAALGLM
jgi:hypothetical protein